VQHYVTNPQVIHETIEGETIIIDLASGTYFSLQGAAPAIWNAIADGRSDEQIVAHLETLYEADAAELGAAVERFLAQLSDDQLIAPSESGADHAPAAEAAHPAQRTGFVPPRLERYTDMQDIILLDPVHKVASRGWPHAAQAASDAA
jgi:hypothetical protein